MDTDFSSLSIPNFERSVLGGGDSETPHSECIDADRSNQKYSLESALRDLQISYSSRDLNLKVSQNVTTLSFINMLSNMLSKSHDNLENELVNSSFL